MDDGMTDWLERFQIPDDQISVNSWQGQNLSIFNGRFADLDYSEKVIIAGLLKYAKQNNSVFGRLANKKYTTEYDSSDTIFKFLFDNGDLQISANSIEEATILLFLAQFIIEDICQTPRLSPTHDIDLFYKFIDDWSKTTNVDLAILTTNIISLNSLILTTDTRPLIKKDKLLRHRRQTSIEYPPDEIVEQLKILICEHDNLITWQSIARYFMFFNSSLLD
jgi:hypothetical protein